MRGVRGRRRPTAPSRRDPLCACRFEAGDTRDTKFYMLSRNVSVVRTALDRMRTQRYKFICLNDDMDVQDREAEAVRAAAFAAAPPPAPLARVTPKCWGGDCSLPSQVSAEVRKFLDFLYPTSSSFETDPTWWGGAAAPIAGVPRLACVPTPLLHRRFRTPHPAPRQRHTVGSPCRSRIARCCRVRALRSRV